MPLLPAMPSPLRSPTGEDATSRQTSSAVFRAIGRAASSRRVLRNCQAVLALSSAAPSTMQTTTASIRYGTQRSLQDALPELHREVRCSVSISFLLHSSGSSCCHQWFQVDAQFLHCAEYRVLGRVLFHLQRLA